MVDSANIKNAQKFLVFNCQYNEKKKTEFGMLRDINNVISFICSCVKGSNSYKALLIRVSTKL